MTTQVGGYDPNQVEASATYIRGLVEAAGRDKLKLALVVGGHILDQFFGGDPNAFSYKGRDSPSLRALLDHPQIAGLKLSHRSVAYYVKVAIQDAQFDGLIGRKKLRKEVKSLGYTKRVRLLPTKKTGDLIRIAEAAATQDLTAAQVEALVKAANAGKTGKARKPDSDEVKAGKRLLNAAHELYLADLSQTKDHDLLAAARFAQSGAKVAGWAADLLAGELTARGHGSPGAKLTDMLAADTPADLGELLTDLVGDDLGLEAAVREDTTDAIRHHGDQILADLQWADAQAAQAWFLDFAAAAVDQLGCANELAAKLGSSEGGKQRATGSRRKTWFLVSAHDTPVDDPATVVEFLQAGQLDRKCVLQASSGDEAVELYCDQVGNLDPDVADPQRVIVAEPLRDVLGSKTTIKAYLSSPRPKRGPTLAEFVADLASTHP